MFIITLVDNIWIFEAYRYKLSGNCFSELLELGKSDDVKDLESSLFSNVLELIIGLSTWITW